MTIIKVNCPDCGDGNVQSGDVELVICELEICSYYEFTCPCCRLRIRKYASSEVISILTVQAQLVPRYQAFPDEPYRQYDQSPLTEDDLAEFSSAIAHLSVAPEPPAKQPPAFQ